MKICPNCDSHKIYYDRETRIWDCVHCGSVFTEPLDDEFSNLEYECNDDFYCPDI